MKGATRAMGAMNRQMNLPALQKIMREFEMQNERMEMTSEVMGDAVDDVFEACALPSTPYSTKAQVFHHRISILRRLHAAAGPELLIFRHGGAHCPDHYVAAPPPSLPRKPSSRW